MAVLLGAPKKNHIILLLLFILFVLLFISNGSYDPIHREHGSGVDSEDLLDLTISIDHTSDDSSHGHGHGLARVSKSTSHSQDTESSATKSITKKSFSELSITEIEQSYNHHTQPLDATKETISEAFARVIRVLHHRSYQCSTPWMVGGKKTENSVSVEGAWKVCADYLPWMYPKLHDLIAISPLENCVVYSFGIAYDFSFDDALADKGCQVYSFDPSMTDIDETLQRSTRSLFIREGLGPEPTEDFQGQSMLTKEQQSWKMNNLEGFMERFNTERITILKIDIEYGEWDAIEAMLLSASNVLSRVDQLLFEVHFWADRRNAERLTELEEMQRWAKILMALELKGFRNFNVHTNPMSSMVTSGFDLRGSPCCYEVSFVRVRSS